MPSGDAMSVSASALAAQRVRLNVIAENIANANTTAIPPNSAPVSAGKPCRRSKWRPSSSCMGDWQSVPPPLMFGASRSTLIIYCMTRLRYHSSLCGLSNRHPAARSAAARAAYYAP
jgi:hypothetical protein